MKIQPYALSSAQLNKLRQNFSLRIAIPIPADAPHGFDVHDFARKSINDLSVNLSYAEESQVSVAPTSRPHRLGLILDNDQLDQWHFTMPVVAVIAHRGAVPRRILPGVQWPGDLSNIYSLEPNRMAQ